MPLKSRQQDGDQRLEAFRAEAVGCFPQCYQCLPNIGAIAHGILSSGWRTRRSTAEHSDRMFAKITGNCDELVQNPLLVGSVREDVQLLETRCRSSNWTVICAAWEVAVREYPGRFLLRYNGTHVITREQVPKEPPPSRWYRLYMQSQPEPGQREISPSMTWKSGICSSGSVAHAAAPALSIAGGSPADSADPLAVAGVPLHQVQQSNGKHLLRRKDAALSLASRRVRDR